MHPAAASDFGRRALLIKLGSIGDVLMAVPGAAALHGQGYAIDWVVSEAVAPLLALYPWIHVLPVNEGRLLRGGSGERVRGIFALWARLRARQTAKGSYDLVATLYYDARYALLALPVRAGRTVRLRRGDRRFELLPGRHHVDEYARILLGAPDGEMPRQLAPVRPPTMPVSPRPRIPGRRRVVLVPAGARNLLRDDALRRWPVELYVELARLLLDAGHEVILSGGPDDRWASEHFAALGSELFTDLIGQCSLLDTLGLFDSADVTVTHDTGPLHLAGLAGTSLVGIFGPTDPHGRLPHREGCVALWGGEGFACRPCYDGRDYAPCLHNGCMSQITPARVFAEIRRLLAARDSGLASPSQVLFPSTGSLVPAPATGPGGAR